MSKVSHSVPLTSSQKSTNGQSSPGRYSGSSNSSSPIGGGGGSGDRRVTIIGSGEGGSAIRNSMVERSHSCTSRHLEKEHGSIGDLLGSHPSGTMGGISLSDFELLGSARGTARNSLDSTTAALDAASLDLTRRRLSVAVVPAAPAAGDPIADIRLHFAASLAARQKHLQQQQHDLELRQKELEIQRQQHLDGMQEHAKPASLLAEEQHSGTAISSSSQEQQWWVCQVCNSKAFASHDEAMMHELSCCPEPQQFADMAAAMPILSDAMPPLDLFAASAYPTAITRSPIMDSPTGLESLTTTAGPFASMKDPMSLAMDSDKDWLTPLHCFVRRNCVEIFTASDDNLSKPSKGKRKPIQVGQVGIRCPHCHSASTNDRSRERGSVYYPTSISSIYNATMNLLQRHLHSCSAVPAHVTSRFAILKSDDARSGTSKRYWIESSSSLGLVDTPNGIRYSALHPPALPSLSNQQHSTGSFSVERRNSNECISTNSNAVAGLNRKAADGVSTPPLDPPDSIDDSRSPASEQSLACSATLTVHEDANYSTKFSFHLISQMQRCVFTEADRLGKRRGLPPGFPGLACRHCYGGFGSGRFFPSSIKTLSDTSKTLNVLYNHMMRCRKCPQGVRDSLERLRVDHDGERGKMKFGSQKAFFARVWGRLHLDGNPGLSPGRKRKAAVVTPEQHSPVALPPLTHSFLDPGYFGPSITMVGGAWSGALSQSNSFSGLDVLGRPLDVPDPKRRKSAA